ncbi:TetR family transcriptional regulator [Mycobacterium bohemicum]|nr:TetR family transcriptional regulator [Mycobacterium bohemicum]MCV6969190.1 TetR family transcriptional regulator [Mycobacterium bohemicum]
MGRWEPNPRERLVRAALELFTEHGCDAITVIDIAQRAAPRSRAPTSPPP